MKIDYLATLVWAIFIMILITLLLAKEFGWLNQINL